MGPGTHCLRMWGIVTLSGYFRIFVIINGWDDVQCKCKSDSEASFSSAIASLLSFSRDFFGR